MVQEPIQVMEEEQGVYSPYIYLIVKWLRASGVEVIENDETLTVTWWGRCWDTEPDGKMRIAVRPLSAKEALFTFAHEAGHWLAATVFGEAKTYYERELQAMIFGWRVLVLVNADKVVPQSEWLQDQLETIDERFNNASRQRIQ